MFERYEELKDLSSKKNFTRYMPKDLKDSLVPMYGETLLQKVATALGMKQKFCLQCGAATKFMDLARGYRDFCSNKCRSGNQSRLSISDNLEKIKKHGDGKFSVHGYEPGKFHYMYDITNTKCGHRFKVTVLNLFKNENYCPECGNKDKYKQLSNRNLARQRPKEVIDSYNLYKNYVLTQTRRLYSEHKHVINPKNLLITRVDLHEDAHNLDHVVPIVYCWENRIDPDLCASLENIRVMKARKNISKNKKLTKEAETLLTKWGF